MPHMLPAAAAPTDQSHATFRTSLLPRRSIAMISPWIWFLATLAGVLVAAGMSAAVKASPWRKTAASTNGAIRPVTLTRSPSGSRANPPPVWRLVVGAHDAPLPRLSLAHLVWLPSPCRRTMARDLSCAHGEASCLGHQPSQAEAPVDRPPYRCQLLSRMCGPQMDPGQFIVHHAG